MQLCRQRESGDELATLAARVAKLERAAAAAPRRPRRRSTRRPAGPSSAATPSSRPPRRHDTGPAAADRPPAPCRHASDADDDVDLRRRVARHRPARTSADSPGRLFAPVEVVAAAGDVVTLSAPNATHQAKCEQQVADVERALRDATGRTIKVRWESAASAADARRRPLHQRLRAIRSTTSITSPTSHARRSTAGRPCSTASPRRSPAPRSSARTTERWPTPSPLRCRR